MVADICLGEISMKRDPKQKTDRNLKILTAIRSYWRDKGTNPSVREIGVAVGIKSSSLIYYYLDDLEEKKKIIRKGEAPHRKIFLHPSELARNPLHPRTRPVIKPVDVTAGVLSIPNYGPIAAGYHFHLPDASFSKTGKPGLDQSVVQIPESYIPQGVKASEVFALHVEGNSMRDAMLTEGDIIILQKISIDQVKDGDIVAAWLIDKQETTLKRFEWGKRTIILRPENPNFETLRLNVDEVEIQGKLLAVLRFVQPIRK